MSGCPAFPANSTRDSPAQNYRFLTNLSESQRRDFDAGQLERSAAEEARGGREAPRQRYEALITSELEKLGASASSAAASALRSIESDLEEEVVGPVAGGRERSLSAHLAGELKEHVDDLAADYSQLARDYKRIANALHRLSKR